MKDSMQWLDIYKERGSQKEGAARVHLMDAVCLINASCPLFYGLTFSSVARSCVPFSEAVCLTSPKIPFPERQKPLGVRLNTKFYMVQGIILLVVELKLAVKYEMDHVAQVLLELTCEYSNVYI